MVWEQRWHPFRREWVIVAAHRNDRPWHGESVDRAVPALPRYDPSCHFCPGNVRACGMRNTAYDGVWVFDNDHPCVGADAPAELAPAPGIFRNAPAGGASRIVCYTPRHDLTLAELGEGEVDALLACWQDQYRELSGLADVAHVLVFENKGAVVGVSNPHPHCQVYATSFVFKTIEEEAVACREHIDQCGTALWEDVVATERADGRRVLVENAHAIAFVPYFARWAYETYVGPLRAVRSIAELDRAERRSLAECLRGVLIRYDNLWNTSFPYVMALHQAPTSAGPENGFGFHIEFHPPLRKPGLRKYLAGPEIGGGSFLSDTSPEEKAAELRAAGGVHYKRTGEGT